MKKITSFTIENQEDFPRISEPVNVAIPFPKGKLVDPTFIRIASSNDEIIYNCNKVITGKWNDNSIKWLNIEFNTTISSNSIETFYVAEIDELANTNSIAPIYIISEEKDCIGNLNFSDRTLILSLRCKLKDDSQLLLNKTSENIIYNNNFKNVTELAFETAHNHPKVEILIRFHEYKEINAIKIETIIKNRSAAIHPGEFWDLNDGGSLFFKELALIITDDKNSEATFSLNSSTPAKENFNTNNFNLVQQSSGGEKWNCKTHIAADGNNYRIIKGAVIETENSKDEASRISPAIFCKNSSSEKVISISMLEFWENFPSSLAKRGNKISVGLFPDYGGEIYELQGGEQKKQTIWIKESDNLQSSDMQWIHKPLVPVFSPQWHEECKIYSYMTVADENDPAEYFELIDNCINEKKSFVKRREEIDEYGWRNYGELYADHESSYLEYNEFNISHYNNQYDFANYAMVQFWRSSDKRWFFLAEQLARHIRDIDTYHTLEDRFTFNGGIFWHTNHYVSAETATHRCFSAKTNPPAAGGISIQNCYIAGLMNHYYTSGDPDTYNSVIETLNYAYNLVMGPEGFKEKFKYFLKEHIKNFYYNTKSKITKQVFPYGLFQGPGRESGNALLILTKAFEFTKDRRYLNAAERILKTSINPRHNLKAMRINEPEYRWMYLLFLQSVIEYIKAKEEINELDQNYKYAIKSFNHYTEWMLKNEYSYLDKPETLEYPNETWAMQELRKTHVLYEAAERADSEDKKNQYIKLAEDLYEKAFIHFNEYEDRRYLTRPLVLAVAYGLVPIYFRRKYKK